MRYVKCDFHGHTNYSDGHMDLESAIASAIAQGLDCIAITEHNILREEKIRSSIPVFSSFELTLEKGHLNIHGWEGPIVINNDAEQINELLKHYEKASFITMNHPFFEPWHFHNQWMEIHRIDGIEVICDPTYPGSGEASRKALDFLMFLWNKGYTTSAVGGSDCHNRLDEFYEGATLPSRFGDPFTFVKSGNLLSNAAKGYSYITRYLQVQISYNGQEYVPGSRIAAGFLDEIIIESEFVSITEENRKEVEALYKNARIQVTADGFGVAEDSFIVGAKQSIILHVAVESWFAIIVRGEDSVPLAVMNPIWVSNDEKNAREKEKKENERKEMFGELLKEYIGLDD